MTTDKSVKIYCESCNADQPMRIDPMRKCENTDDSVWGDICCAKCYLVLATITVPDEGVYAFLKVSDL